MENMRMKEHGQKGNWNYDRWRWLRIGEDDLVCAADDVMSEEGEKSERKNEDYVKQSTTIKCVSSVFLQIFSFCHVCRHSANVWTECWIFFCCCCFSSVKQNLCTSNEFFSLILPLCCVSIILFTFCVRRRTRTHNSNFVAVWTGFVYLLLPHGR